MEWKPIESAPKDGSKFLFIEEKGRIQVGRMDSEWGGGKSLFVCLTGTGADWYPSVNPTHWMPLPEPPK